MITKKRIKIPLYPCVLTTIIFDEKEDVIDKYPFCNGEEGAYKMDYNTQEATILIKSSEGVTAICHEAHHIKSKIFILIGQKSDVDNDEVDAYLVGWIASEVTNVYHKHKELKNGM